MTTYLVTLELKTPFIWKVLRFFRIKNKREEFKLNFQYVGYEENEILTTSNNIKVKVLGHE